ncbi:MAG: hypothetical protein KF709_08680 [Gemmatimonadaceae bacterium]|nr:hypothetical protein [Gemmatimonadaceae bacterium]
MPSSTVPERVRNAGLRRRVLRGVALGLAVLLASACDAPTETAILMHYELRAIGDSAVPATFAFGPPDAIAPLLVRYGVDTIAVAANGSGYWRQKELRWSDTPLFGRDLSQDVQITGIGGLRLLVHSDCWGDIAPCSERASKRILEFGPERMVLESPFGEWLFVRIVGFAAR